MKFSINDFFSECDQIRSLLRIWSHLLKKSLMENFIFCVVIIEHVLVRHQSSAIFQLLTADSDISKISRSLEQKYSISIKVLVPSYLLSRCHHFDMLITDFITSITPMIFFFFFF